MSVKYLQMYVFKILSFTKSYVQYLENHNHSDWVFTKDVKCCQFCQKQMFELSVPGKKLAQINLLMASY